MLRNSTTVCQRTAEELLRVPTNDILGNDEAERQCFGEWLLESLSNNDGNFVSGTLGHWSLLACFHGW